MTHKMQVKNSMDCIDCPEFKNCKDSFTSWIFFIVGLVATIAIRLVTILVHMDPFYSKIAWYVGIGGFFIFFVYRYRIHQARAKVITERNIAEKINKRYGLSDDDYAAIGAILCGLRSKKEAINYLFIFGLSAAALFIAVYMDFIK